MWTRLTLLTKMTVVGLVTVAIALWTQWLSGDAAYGRFPAGPVVFVFIAGIIVWGVRWWWTPLIGGLISLLVTSGWFARLHQGMQRLTHPGSVGTFAAGIFVGGVLQIVGLIVTDFAGLAATVDNYRHRKTTGDGAKMASRMFGGVFVLMSVMAMVGGAHVDPWHNAMHLVWGALALGVSFMGVKVAKQFCIASGVFYIGLAACGLLLGDPARHSAWQFGPMLLDTGDHIFHLVMGAIFLTAGVASGREVRQRLAPQTES